VIPGPGRKPASLDGQRPEKMGSRPECLSPIAKIGKNPLKFKDMPRSSMRNRDAREGHSGILHGTPFFIRMQKLSIREPQPQPVDQRSPHPISLTFSLHG
jgi:hypothetical protein